MIGGKKDFIDLKDFTQEELQLILDTAEDLKKKTKRGEFFTPLSGKTFGMLFAKASTRTRVSFETGISQLGGTGIFLQNNELQIGRGETIEDTGKVLERYIDGMMIRTFRHRDVTDLAAATRIPVINGLTDYNHPCQIMADFQTIIEHKGRLRGLRMAYIGDGNNVANTLVAGASKMGIFLTVASPKGYECSPEIIAQADKKLIRFIQDPEEAVRGADILYTDVWTSMGQEDEREKRLRDFKGYCIDSRLAGLASDDFIFLHCLPAHRGEEVSASVIDGPHSKVFDQAENRLHAQKAIMYLLMRNEPYEVNL